MSTGIESPQSVSTVVYYKGFSMTITKRDKDADVLPVVEDQLKLIDTLITRGCVPSWNDETNTKALASQPVSQPTTEAVSVSCEVCGKPALEKKGTTKAGKPYHGIFCSSEDRSHTRWLWN